MICSLDGFTTTYFECSCLHSQYIRKNKIKTQFQEKNWRFVVSKFVKLSDELVKSEIFEMMTD